MQNKCKEGFNKILRGTISLAEILRVMEWYDSIASSYDGLYAREQRNKYSIIGKVLKAGGKKVLDLGCGTGEFLLFSCEKFLKNSLYLGIDLSFNLLNIAREKILSLTDSCDCIAEFVAGDLLYPPIRENAKFDLILLISVLCSMYRVNAITNYYAQNHLEHKGILTLTIMYEDENRDASRDNHCPNGSKLLGKAYRNEIICVVTKHKTKS